MQALTFVKARVEVRPQAVFLDSLRACVQSEIWMEQIRVWEQLEVKVPAPDKTIPHDMLGEDSTNTQTHHSVVGEKLTIIHVKMLCRRRETDNYTRQNVVS